MLTGTFPPGRSSSWCGSNGPVGDDASPGPGPGSGGVRGGAGRAKLGDCGLLALIDSCGTPRGLPTVLHSPAPSPSTPPHSSANSSSQVVLSEGLLPAPKPLQPGSQPLLPTTYPLLPASQPHLPASQPLLPAAYPLLPPGQPLLPTGQPLLPEAQPLLPEAQPPLPAGQPPQSPAQPTVSWARLPSRPHARRSISLNGGWPAKGPLPPHSSNSAATAAGAAAMPSESRELSVRQVWWGAGCRVQVCGGVGIGERHVCCRVQGVGVWSCRV